MDALVTVSVCLMTVFTDVPALTVGPALIVLSLSNYHATITKIMTKVRIPLPDLFRYPDKHELKYVFNIGCHLTMPLPF